MILGFVSLLSLSCLSTVFASLPDGRRNANMIRISAIDMTQDLQRGSRIAISRKGTELPPLDTVYEFDQLIDHNNPSLGTFKQRYWHNAEFYQPGGPIVLITPGEINAEGQTRYLTNETITGTTAQRNNGTVVVIEHRFFGLSNPAPDLSGKSLQGLHTVQQAIDDLEYFAFNVKLPQPDGDNVTPDKAPWILAGGSYPGALTSWTMVNKPGLFAAGYASSAVVQAIDAYWGYWEPIRKFMPKNCSADIEAVIAHVDTVFSGNNETAINELKNNWGLGNVTHLDDVVAALRQNLFDWQRLEVGNFGNVLFNVFCDFLEVDAETGATAPEEGFGLEHALKAWGDFWVAPRTRYIRILCGNIDPEECLGTHNATSKFYTDTSINNAQRSFMWMSCNELGYFKPSPPEGRPAIISSLLKLEYDIRQCELLFSDVFSESNPPPVAEGVARTNEVYHGWNVSEEHLFFTNGKRDPWVEATVSATGVDVPSTSSQPVLLSEGFHASDLTMENGDFEPSVKAIHDQWFSTIPVWLQEWTPGKVEMTKRGGSVET